MNWISRFNLDLRQRFYSNSTNYILDCVFFLVSDFLFKFLVIGSAGTGKSCILHQFIENKCKYNMYNCYQNIVIDPLFCTSSTTVLMPCFMVLNLNTGIGITLHNLHTIQLNYVAGTLYNYFNYKCQSLNQG